MTGGVNLLPPVGLIDFSVGDTDVVVGVVLEGLGFSPPPQPAVSAPMAMIALPPATSATRRAKRPDFNIPDLSFYPRVMFADDGVTNRNVNIMAQFRQTVSQILIKGQTRRRWRQKNTSPWTLSSLTRHCLDSVKPNQLPSVENGVNIRPARAMVTNGAEGDGWRRVSTVRPRCARTASRRTGPAEWPQPGCASPTAGPSECQGPQRSWLPGR
jgi:hypothetical protein